MKYRTGDNPARWRGHLDHLLPKRSRVATVNHHAALPIDETPGFIQTLQREETVVARALAFCILNATRTNETMGMRWSEYDEKARLWTAPGARMKAGRDHRIPLAPRSLSILTEMQDIRSGDFVFPGGVQERLNVIPDGPHVMTITKVEHQIKVGDSWNKDGTETVDFDTWISYPEEKRRLHLSLQLVGTTQLIWHDLYMVPTAAGFLKDFLKAARVQFDASGFDTDALQNAQILAAVTTKDEGYGEQARITKVQRA